MKYLIFILLLMPLANADILINEVMYDAVGDDNNLEYIELFSNESFPLNLTVDDLSNSDNLKLIQSSNSSYALIVEEGFNYSEINATIYSAGPTIGNNLNNDRDIVIIKNSSVIFDAVNYDESLGGKLGLSLCKLNSTLIQCYPTPGYKNNISLALENVTSNYSQVYNKSKNLILDSNLVIEKIYNKDIKFGDLISIRIKVYKGDTRKEEIRLYVKDLSKQTKVLLRNRFTNYTLTLPVQLNPRCVNSSPEYHDLILEGLNQNAKEIIKISGFNADLCQKVIIKGEKVQEKSASNKVFTNKTVALANNSESLKYGKNAVIVYEASDVKAKRFALYFFCFALIVMIIYYEFKGKK